MKLNVIVTSQHNCERADAGEYALPVFPDSGFMSCARSLLLLLSVLPCAALADEEARYPGASGEQSVQTPDIRRDTKLLEEKRRLKHLWQQLSHEERDALRQQMRANWERMTPKERRQLHQAYRRHQELRENRRGEGRNDDTRREEQAQQREARKKAHEAYWRNLTLEEREALRNALRETIRHWRQHEGATEIMAEALPEAFPAKNANGKEKTTPPEAR